MRGIVDEIRGLHDGYDALPDLAKARVLRRHCYSRIVLASTRDSRLPREMLDGDLAGIFAAFDRHEAGVWCSGAATTLMRMYHEAGFRAWKYTYGTYGSDSPVTHAVTLVDLGGDLYLQDAYFNTDYVAEDGRALGFLEILERLKAGRAVRLRQDPGVRRGLFASEADARSWMPSPDDELACDRLPDGRLLCRFVMDFETYRRRHPQAGDVSRWLAEAGHPDDWAYLLLYPRPGQKFLSVSAGSGGTRLQPDRELAARIAHAIGRPAGVRTGQPGAPPRPACNVS